MKSDSSIRTKSVRANSIAAAQNRTVKSGTSGQPSADRHPSAGIPSAGIPSAGTATPFERTHPSYAVSGGKDITEYHAIFNNNSFKGDLYLMKLRNSDVLYLGIPVAHSRLLADRSETFCFNIIEPDAESGVYEVPFENIEFAVVKHE